MTDADPERDRDDQDTGDKEPERGVITDVHSVSVDFARQSSVRYEKQQ